MATKVKVRPVTPAELEAEAMKVLKQTLRGEREPDAVSQLAMKTLNLAARDRQMGLTRDRMRAGLIRTFATPEEMRKYVMTTQPEIKRLMAG